MPDDNLNDQLIQARSEEGICHLSPDPISHHLTTLPSKSTIVHQGKLPVYYTRGVEALYAATHTYLDRIENVQLMHWSNSTPAAQMSSEPYTTGLKVTQGEPLSTSVNLGAEFKGLSVGSSGSVRNNLKKTFTDAETSSSETHSTAIVTIPAHTDVWFYQRKYVFRTKMTWILDSSNEFCNVGSKGNPGSHIQEGTVITEIYTKNFITTTKALTGQLSLELDGTGDTSYLTKKTKKFGDLTSRCRSTLQGMGIDGSQQA